MKYGLEMEPIVINRYVTEKVKESSNISIKMLGLSIDKDHGFIAASPGGGVEENNSLVGIVECEVALKWSQKTVGDGAKEPGHPLKSVKINQNGTAVKVFVLKPNYAWYHQIQLQLYACRSFAKYCDLALLHPESESFHCQRSELNQEWVDQILPKLETFFDKYIADIILQKYKKKYCYKSAVIMKNIAGYKGSNNISMIPIPSHLNKCLLRACLDAHTQIHV